MLLWKKIRLNINIKLGYIENNLFIHRTLLHASLRADASNSAYGTPLTSSALAVANYCKKAVAAYGNILPPLVIPEPIIRPNKSSDSNLNKTLSTTSTVPPTLAQGKQSLT